MLLFITAQRAAIEAARRKKIERRVRSATGRFKDRPRKIATTGSALRNAMKRLQRSLARRMASAEPVPAASTEYWIG